MSSIVGLLELDRRPATREDVERLSAASTQRLPGGHAFRLCSSFALGWHRAGPGPEPDADGEPWVSTSGTLVAFDGRLDNRADLAGRYLARVSASTAASLSDAALVAAAYEETGDRVASRLNGDFALALFDPRTGRLLLARDVMGARDLHYTLVGRRVLFASEIKPLLADPRVSSSPDQDTLAELLLDKWDDGHHTCFTGIYGVPPGHTVVAQADRALEIRPHDAFDPSRRIRLGSAGEYVEAFRTVFEQAVRRRLRSRHPVAVLVSGGVDSSSVYCQAVASRRTDSSLAPVRGVFMAFPAGTDADESQYVEELERWCDGPIARIAVPTLRQLVDAPQTIANLEFPTLVWHAHSQLYAEAQRAGCHAALDGYFGDQMLFGRGYLVDLARHGRWLKVRHDLRQFGRWMDGADRLFQLEFRSGLLRSVVPDRLFAAGKRRARGVRTRRYAPWYTTAFLDRLLARQLTRFPAAHAASRHAEEYYRHATAGHYLFYFRRQSLTARMHDLELACPFRDRDLVAFLMAIPGEFVNAGGVPKGVIREALAGVLPPGIRARRWKADFTAASNQGLVEDFETISALLTRDCLAARAGIVDGRIVERSIQAYRELIGKDHEAIAGWQVGELVALELWLRHFFG